MSLSVSPVKNGLFNKFNVAESKQYSPDVTANISKTSNLAPLAKDTVSFTGKTAVIETHSHGAFGIDLIYAGEQEIRTLSEKFKERGIVAYCPTLVTDDTENIKRQLGIIKKIMKDQEENGVKPNEAEILGVHLEGVFINPKRKGIHNADHIRPATIEEYERLGPDADIIKSVTMAPEVDEGGKLAKYLADKGIKVQAGHTTADRVYPNVSGLTHTLNAMPGLDSRAASVSLDGATNPDIHLELIGDLAHIQPQMAQLLIHRGDKYGPYGVSKTLIVSDSAPLAHSENEEGEFCGQKIMQDRKRKLIVSREEVDQLMRDEGLSKEEAVGKATIGGSGKLLDEIADELVDKKIVTPEQVKKLTFLNQLNYLGIKGEQRSRIENEARKHDGYSEVDEIGC